MSDIKVGDVFISNSGNEARVLFVDSETVYFERQSKSRGDLTIRVFKEYFHTKQKNTKKVTLYRSLLAYHNHAQMTTWDTRPVGIYGDAKILKTETKEVEYEVSDD